MFADQAAASSRAVEHYRILSCCDVAGVRPAKRRASLLKVAEYHNSAGEQLSFTDTDQQFFSEFCHDSVCTSPCAGEVTCNSPCLVPCRGDEQCTPDNVCYDQRCEQFGCADGCEDPNCTKISCPDATCYCRKCGALPCPLDHLQEKCPLTHSAPTDTGTIKCFDNTTCHFQTEYHGFDPTLSNFESYQCLNPSNQTLGKCHVDPSSTTTPVLSPSNYTSLGSALSGQSSPASGPGLTSQCPLPTQNPLDHCHRGDSCCHGATRECGDGSSWQNQHNMWNSSSGQDSGLENSFLDFGFQQSQPLSTLSMDMVSADSASTFGHGMQNSMSEYGDSSWMLPNSHFPTGLGPPMVEHGNKLDYLALATQSDVLKQDTPGTSTSLMTSTVFETRPKTSNSTDSSEACICKWQLSSGQICHAIFDSPSSLHAHVKTAHVDNCMRCFCQWENCESCNKDFKQRSKLSRHLLAHAGYRPYHCSWNGCTKTFATNQAKDNHERTHTGSRPYKCDQCGYNTTTHTQLQTHISALHLNQKPHKCRFCDFTCADSSNLSKHERTHQSLRPYRCPHPNCTFKPDCRWENLKRHLRRSNHCPKLLIESSDEYRAYRENVKRQVEEFYKRDGVDGGASKAISRRKGRG
ncbi:hypothetical protein K504DRAFT_390173 [Pleomassaria siparia CBS 279.74]|uniref:C2H2 type master regulator of conidiophore development brlA n=1 Tax=Pleomassaria siparia CBS 279.74 TaxID=1314801 RepID=A0A6G1JWD2_9PLEO|nr:hypothetical protein K504DRAFT_390173 [Pleomassaria siparia CBS 279.74]